MDFITMTLPAPVDSVLNAIGPNSVVLCHGKSTEELLEETATEAAQN